MPLTISALVLACTEAGPPSMTPRAPSPRVHTAALDGSGGVEEFVLPDEVIAEMTDEELDEWMSALRHDIVADPPLGELLPEVPSATSDDCNTSADSTGTGGAREFGEEGAGDTGARSRTPSRSWDARVALLSDAEGSADAALLPPGPGIVELQQDYIAAGCADDRRSHRRECRDHPYRAARNRGEGEEP